MREQMNVRVEASTKRELEGLAVAQGISLNRLVERTCEEALAALVAHVPEQAPEPRVPAKASGPAVKHQRAYRIGSDFYSKCDTRVAESHWR